MADSIDETTSLRVFDVIMGIKAGTKTKKMAATNIHLFDSKTVLNINEYLLATDLSLAINPFNWHLPFQLLSISS
jgi:hypothetical protein